MSTTLLAGNVLRTPYVPGAQLRNQRGLLPASVLRTPYVPGALLQTAADGDTITAALYNLADLDTKIADLEFVNSPTIQELHNEPGSGALSLDMEDPALALFANDGTDIIYFTYRGVQGFEMIPNLIREIFIATSEEPDEVTIYTGLGPLGVLVKAIVFPTNGPGRSPIEEDRHLGWMTREYDHSSWDTVEVLGDINHAMDVIAFELSVPVEDIEAKVRQNLPFTGLIPVVGPPGTSMSLDAPVGDWYVYEDETMNPTLNIPTDGDYFIYFGPVDDEMEAYVDGQQVATMAGLNVFGVTSAAVSLTAGPHSVATHVRNLAFTSPNPTKVSWQIATEPSVATLLDPGGDSTLIAYSCGDAKVLAYPPTVPGQTILKSFRILLQEAQNRGKLPNVVCMFTDTHYSDGRVAEPIPDFGTKVGTNLMNVAREITTYVDVKGKVVQVGGVRKIGIFMWEKDTRGSVTDVVFERAAPGGDDSTGNLNQYERQTELILVDDALVRWDGGWTLLDTADGPYSAEAPLEIGAPASIEEVLRMTLAALNDVNTPKGEITAGLEPRDASEAPYTGFDVADTISSTPTGAEKVMGWTMTVDDDGNTVIKVTLGNVLLSRAARQALELQKAQ